MIADQIPSGPSHSDATFQESHFQLAQAVFATTISECDQGMDHNAALGGVRQRPLDLWPVEAEDHDFHALLGFTYRFNNAVNTVSGLDDQFH